MNKRPILFISGFLVTLGIASCTVHIHQETSSEQDTGEPGDLEVIVEDESSTGSVTTECETLPETNQASDAVPIKPGCYTGELGGELASGNRDNEDWYTFSVDTGQIISLVLTQPENSSISVGLYRPNSKSTGSVSTVGNIRTLRYVADVSGEWWVKIIRSSGGGKFLLELSITNQNDAGSGKDAGDTSEALVIKPGTIEGFLKAADNEDWYTFNVDINQNIHLELTQPEDTSISMVLYRPNTKQAGSVTTLGNVRTLKYLTDVKGNWFVKVIRSSGEGTYILKLEVTE